MTEEGRDIVRNDAVAALTRPAGRASVGPPVFRADADLAVVDLALALDVDGERYTLSGCDPERLAVGLRSLNGIRTVPEVASSSGIPPASMAKLVADLLGIGAVTAGPRSDDPVDGERYAALCRRLYVPWKRRLFSHPLWTGLVDGSLPQRVFTGWAIESYWFIDGVIDRLPMAVATSDSPAVRSLFAQHFAEEWDHFLFFAETLDALGIDLAQRQAGRPLPATQAVQNWMRRAARRGSVHYATCSGFLESTGTDRSNARSFFDSVGQYYDDANRRALGPMAAHVALDEDYGHGSIVERVLREVGPIPLASATAAIQDAYGLVETLEMWSTDIMRHYRSAASLPLRELRRYRAGEP